AACAGRTAPKFLKPASSGCWSSRLPPPGWRCPPAFSRDTSSKCRPALARPRGESWRPRRGARPQRGRETWSACRPPRRPVGASARLIHCNAKRCHFPDQPRRKDKVSPAPLAKGSATHHDERPGRTSISKRPFVSETIVIDTAARIFADLADPQAVNRAADEA